MKRTIFTLAVVATLASPAWANQCPAMAAQIEAALAASTADDATKAQATTLMQEGMALHDAGDHAASVEKMTEAMTLLGIAPQ